MTKKELIDALAGRTILTISQATHAVDGLIEVVADALAKDEPLFLRGFATIKTVQRKERSARDIANGKQIKLPSYKDVKFIASAVLKTRINNPNK